MDHFLSQHGKNEIVKENLENLEKSGNFSVWLPNFFPYFYLVVYQGDLPFYISKRSMVTEWKCDSSDCNFDSLAALFFILPFDSTNIQDIRKTQWII